MSVSFRTREYGEGNNSVAASLVAGFTGKITDFETAARSLLVCGHDVVAYEYDNDVLLAGDATLLPQLIADISNDFQLRAREHPIHRHAGASLGGGIAWYIQKHSPETAPGMFAAAGANAARLIMKNLAFRGIIKALHKIDPKKEFMCHGHDLQSLQAEWEELHQPPTTNFGIVLGGLDYIVKQREVLSKFNHWETTTPISIHIKRRKGHTGVIKWFNENILAMDTLTKNL